MSLRIPARTMFVALLLAGPAATALPQRIVALEWLPLGMHAEVLRSFESDMKSASPNAPALVRRNAQGDADELNSVLADLALAPPAQVMGFGGRVCLELSAKLPGVPLMAVMGRQDVWEKGAIAGRRAATVVFVTEPEASLVLDVAMQLLPKMDSLAILYTEDFGANVALAGALERETARKNRRLIRLTVPAGNCRTDSDFEKALDVLREAKTPLVFYVPDDPNCSRFGNVICQLAAERHIVTLGSEATIGKGCAAALALDTEVLGKRCAEWSRHSQSGQASIDLRKAPYRVVIDPAAVAEQGLTLTDELKARSVPTER